MNTQAKRNFRMAIAFVVFIGLAVLTALLSERSDSLGLFIIMAIADGLSFCYALFTTLQACRKPGRVRRIYCLPFFPLLVAALVLLSLSPSPIRAQQAPSSGSYIYTVVASDGFLHNASTGESLLDANGNRVFISADGSLKAMTPDGTVVQPRFINILGIVVGLIIIAVGCYVAYKLYKWAKRVVNPPPPPPPTNPPPPMPWTNPPPVAFVATNCEMFADDSVGTNGWTDWQGNPIGYCIFGTVRMSEISSNLVSWNPTTCYVTGYVSVNVLDSRGMDYETESNMLLVSYDEHGTPFATNWSRLSYDSASGAMTNKLLGASYSVPRVPGRAAMFYRMAHP